MKKMLDVLSKIFAAIALITGLLVLGTSDVADGGFLFLLKLLVICGVSAGLSKMCSVVAKGTR